MQTKTKFKVFGVFCAVVLVLVMVLFGSVETFQQKAYDAKADLMGTHRVVNVYAQETGQLVSTYEDKEMRFELVGERSVRVWMGDQNKKVMIINMGVTIADQ